MGTISENTSWQNLNVVLIRLKTLVGSPKYTKLPTTGGFEPMSGTAGLPGAEDIQIADVDAGAMQIFTRWPELYLLVRERLSGLESNHRILISVSGVTGRVAGQHILVPGRSKGRSKIRWETKSVASIERARRDFAQWREQYTTVRERLARNCNAAISMRSSS